ncbi:MAG TPA: GatB/YqeY domain-containing protein [Rhodocyclaceae bacterium]|nr:GatB/YqeY domain-containing protein [Rhodocyclaceae bacterium]
MDRAIDSALTESAATGPGDMGKAMGLLKVRLSGRADMADVSRRVRARLGN